MKRHRFTEGSTWRAAWRRCQGAVALSVVLVAALAGPSVLHAQGAEIDREALRQTVQNAAVRVAQTTQPVAVRGSAAQVGAQVGSAESLAPPPGVEDLPEDDSATAPDGAQTDATQVPATDEWQEFSNAGVTVSVPGYWEIVSPDAETVFATGAPDSDFAIVLIDIGSDIPSFIGLTLFRVAGGDMLPEWIPDAEMVAVESAFTSQGIPMIRLDFDATIDGKPATGTFFVISAGSQAYVLLVAGTEVEFDIYAEEAEDVLASLTFDPELITYVQAEDGPLAYADAAEQVSVFLPPGWFAADTNDEQLPLMLLDPDVRYVVMLTTDTSLGTAFDMSMEALFETEDGMPDPALLDELTSGLTDLLGANRDDLTFDPALTETFTREGGLTVRMVGKGDFGDGAVSPTAFYFDLRSDSGVLGMLVGDIEPALADEQTLLDIVGSVGVPE